MTVSTAGELRPGHLCYGNERCPPEYDGPCPVAFASRCHGSGQLACLLCVALGTRVMRRVLLGLFGSAVVEAVPCNVCGGAMAIECEGCEDCEAACR